jgi:hypothetical protein
MPYCPNCQREKQGAFCDNCGTRLLDSAPQFPQIEEQWGDTGLDRSARQAQSQNVTINVIPTAPASERARPPAKIAAFAIGAAALLLAGLTVLILTTRPWQRAQPGPGPTLSSLGEMPTPKQTGSATQGSTAAPAAGTEAPVRNVPDPHSTPVRLADGRLGEAENNGGVSRGNRMLFGDTVWGTIDPAGDLDYYCFDVPAGTKVVLDINASVEGSPLNSYLQLWDAWGALVAGNDNDGSTSDSRVELQLDRNGTYCAEVLTNTGAGGPTYRYALQLGPAGVEPPPLPTPLPPRDEREPNDGLSRGNSISFGDTVWGTIDPAGDLDYYCFDVPAGTKVTLDINAFVEGSAFNSYLQLWDALGTLVAGNDNDGSSADSRIEWQADKSGTYCVEVLTKTGAGGPTYRYALQLGAAGTR